MFTEDFKEKNSVWTLSPNDYSRILFENDSLFLLHGEETISYSLQCNKDDELVFQAQVHHEPKRFDDISCVYVQTTSEDIIELQNYYSAKDEHYKKYYNYIKIVKQNNTLSFYSSIDSIKWDKVGVSSVNTDFLIGFSLYGEDKTLSKFNIINSKIYKNNYVIFNNIPSNSTIKIFNSDNIDISTVYNIDFKYKESKCIINLTNAILPIATPCIKIYNSIGNEIYSQNIDDIYGGDVFNTTENFEFKLKDFTGVSGTAIDVGNLTGLNNYYEITITNKSIEDMTSRIIKVGKSGFNSNAYRYTKIALKDKNKNFDDLEFLKELELPKLRKDESMDIVLRIQKNPSVEVGFFNEQCIFKLLIV